MVPPVVQKILLVVERIRNTTISAVPTDTATAKEGEKADAEDRNAIRNDEDDGDNDATRGGNNGFATLKELIVVKKFSRGNEKEKNNTRNKKIFTCF